MKRIKQQSNNYVNTTRNEQVTYKPAKLVSPAPGKAPVYPGVPFIDLGAATKQYNELTNFQPKSTSDSIVAHMPKWIDYGRIGVDDSGADWTKGDDNMLIPNGVAEQIELKLGLVEARIRNSMYTDLDILFVEPTLHTKLGTNVISNGDTYARYLLGSKYNSFILTKFWTDIQAVMNVLIYSARNNKILFDRANMLINEMKRAKVQAALKSLEVASSMIMTDLTTCAAVMKNSGVRRLDDSLLSPFISVEMTMNRQVYKSKEDFLKVKYTKEGANTEYALTLDAVELTSARNMFVRLWTENDETWLKTVEAYAKEVMDNAKKLALSIANIQKPYQYLNTAIMQIGNDLFQPRYGFRRVSVDIFANCNVDVSNIIKLSIFKTSSVTFDNSQNVLAKVVSAIVPANIENLPIDQYKTNFVLVTKDCGDDYKALIDLSDFGPQEIICWSDSITPNADNETVCTVMNGVLVTFACSFFNTKLFGKTALPLLSINSGKKAMGNFVGYCIRKLFPMLSPFFYVFKNQDKGDYFIQDNIFGVVTVAYKPIVDQMLMNAVKNFGLLD